MSNNESINNIGKFRMLLKAYTNKNVTVNYSKFSLVYDGSDKKVHLIEGKGNIELKSEQLLRMIEPLKADTKIIGNKKDDIKTYKVILDNKLDSTDSKINISLV